MLTSIYETVIEGSGEQTEGKVTNFPGAVCVCDFTVEEQPERREVLFQVKLSGNLQPPRISPNLL